MENLLAGKTPEQRSRLTRWVNIGEAVLREADRRLDRGDRGSVSDLIHQYMASDRNHEHPAVHFSWAARACDVLARHYGPGRTRIMSPFDENRRRARTWRRQERVFEQLVAELIGPELPTPNLDKMLKVHDSSQAIGEFTAWLREQGISFMVWRRHNEAVPGGEWSGIGDDTEHLLARFFDVDLEAADQERRALLEYRKKRGWA